MTKSLRWRLMFKPRMYQVPIVHPAEERWRRAAYGDPNSFFCFVSLEERLRR